MATTYDQCNKRPRRHTGRYRSTGFAIATFDFVLDSGRHVIMIVVLQKSVEILSPSRSIYLLSPNRPKP